MTFANLFKELRTSLHRKRGFGLIDVSLGIIAGIGLLVGAVILFQQVSTNNAVAEVTRNAASISSEIRAAARNLDSFDDLPATGAAPDRLITLAQFGLETAILNNPAVTAVAGTTTFELQFRGMTRRACERAAVVPGNLGANVVTGGTPAATRCDVTVPADPVLHVTYSR